MKSIFPKIWTGTWIDTEWYREWIMQYSRFKGVFGQHSRPPRQAFRIWECEEVADWHQSMWPQAPEANRGEPIHHPEILPLSHSRKKALWVANIWRIPFKGEMMFMDVSGCFLIFVLLTRYERNSWNAKDAYAKLRAKKLKVLSLLQVQRSLVVCCGSNCFLLLRMGIYQNF